MDGDPPHELSIRHGPEVRLGNELCCSRVRVFQLLCDERREVLLDGLEVASGPPEEAFASEFAERTQEALSISRKSSLLPVVT
jgi:hypothetical protein